MTSQPIGGQPPRTGPRGRLPVLARADAAKTLAGTIKPGQHVVMIAPTGRGKSTLLSQIIPHTGFDRVVLLCPKGADPHYAKLGHTTTVWPPKLRWQDSLSMVFGAEDRHRERPQVWRIEVDIRKDADEALQAKLFHSVLVDVRRRYQNQRDSIMVVLDDSQLISDQQDATKRLVNHLMLISRAKRASMVNMYQGPTFVPRRALDQPEHVLVWRNRDRDVARRLAEIADIDSSEMLGIMQGLEFYESLWINARSDRLVIIGQ